MATSIDDLLTTLDRESRRPHLESAQCVQALSLTARMLQRLREAGAGDTAGRDATVRRLAESCAEAAVTFEAGPGRLSDLAGITSDAIGRTCYELTEADRWAVATRIAPIARRLARQIAGAGPYRNVPQLLAVADRSRELIATAVRSPADPDQLGGLQIPIPNPDRTVSLTDSRAVIESMARLVAEFHRPGRQPMTIRQMIAVTHAAEAVTEAAVQLDPRRSAQLGEEVEPADSWRRVREYLARITDESRGRPDSNDVVVAHALDVHRAAHRLIESRGNGAAPNQDALDAPMIDRAMTLVPMLAADLERDLRKPALRYAAAGPRPLHKERVAEWLLHQPFVVREHDLRPAIAMLQQTVRESHGLRATGTLSQPTADISERPNPSAAIGL